MAIVQTPQYWIKTIILMGVIGALTACGGGGGSSDSSNSSSAPSIDTKPEAFSFAPLGNQLPGEEVTSNSVTITGINSAATIAITNGQYSIGEAAFTEVAGTITNGQSVKIRLIASENTFTETTATLTVGGVSANFTVKTLPDIKPDTFSFAPAENVEPVSANTSDKVLVSGFDIAVPITIEGGEYAIDDGEFTIANGEVEPRQSVTVRVIASEALTESVEAVVTIGGVAGTYVVTTLADTTAPTAEFMFPPPVSMTEGDQIRIRGKVADKYSEIASADIIINGATQPLTLTTNEDGTAAWDLTVENLIPDTDNIIIIATEDNLGNKEENAATVVIRQDASLSSFPNSGEVEIPNPGVAVIDRMSGRNRLLVGDGYQSDVYEVDIATAKRKLLTTFPNTKLTGLTDIVLDERNNRILMRDNDLGIASMALDDPMQIVFHEVPSLGNGYAFVLNTVNAWKLVGNNAGSGDIVLISQDLKTTEVFSSNRNPDQGIQVSAGLGMAFDKINQRYLMVGSPPERVIYAIDSITGVKSVFSSNEVGSGDLFGAAGTALRQLAVDEKNQRVILSEAGSGKLFIIDSETGDRKVLTSPTIPNTFNPMHANYGLVFDDPDSYAFVCDREGGKIFAVDMVTGERVYFSKN